MRPPAPRVAVLGRSAARAVVLVLHGGQEHGKQRAHRLRPPYLRMLPFAIDLWLAGFAVWQLCYRYRGWNEPDLDPVADARWALSRIRVAHPGLPVVLVGHSMGGRTALRVAGEPGVVAVCALAPWTTAKDPVDQLAGRDVLIAHGDRDTTTHPTDSRAYASRAELVSDTVSWLDIPGDGHAMLRRAATWARLVRRFVLGALR